MKSCDCHERIGTKILSYKQLIELKDFFEGQVARGIFADVPVERPYFVSPDTDLKLEWYADKWYRCLVCGTLWEVIYPDPPAFGEVIKNDESNGETGNGSMSW